MARSARSGESPPTLRDLLAHLGIAAARKLLGGRAKELTAQARAIEIEVEEMVRWTKDALSVHLREAVVTLRRSDASRSSVHSSCSQCSRPCVHLAAVLNLVLEEKVALGLAIPPPDSAPPADLDDGRLVELALSERAERAAKERMLVRSLDPVMPWTDYEVTSRESGRSYRVAMRGTERGDSYCSCPDFRKNTLGTCKHILHVLAKLRRRFRRAQLEQAHVRRRISLSIGYGAQAQFRLLPPKRCDPSIRTLIADFGSPLVDGAGAERVLEVIRRIQRLGEDVMIYPDAEERIGRLLLTRRLQALCKAIRKDPARHPLRTSLLRVELLPYQLDGVAFAVAAGRAILADDMGLGKTIQAIGVAELLARETDVRRVLVVCPASVKSQWLSEIGKFSTRTAGAVFGGAKARSRCYGGDQFFTICNYEQVLRDHSQVRQQSFDLIVLDEAQRIKNWESKTAKVIKSLESTFALVLSGTPLENRLDELYSIVEFVDERRLGPAFRFFHRHRNLDENGRVVGFRRLDALRAELAPILLRRTRDEVVKQLPERSTQVIRIRPAAEQKALHDSHMSVVASIVRKAWISEIDLLRLQKALLMCRMSADSTFLVDKERPAASTKLDRLAELFDDLLWDEDRKVVLFSEWTTMLTEIERVLAPMLAEHGATAVRLDGKVPAVKRQQLVRRFRDEPRCRVFLTTNAGSTGLNLQAANTVVNVDLPWNPALLEQRIGRAHRMGQKRAVQVYLLVTEDTIEENMLATLSVKHELFQAVLDPDSMIDSVDLRTGVEELRRRLEVLLGAKPTAPIDQGEQRAVEAEVKRLAGERTRVAEASGRILAAAFDLLGGLVPAHPEPDASAHRARISAELLGRLEQCVECDAEGRPRLVVTLPSRDALASLASSLAGLLTSAGKI